MTISMEKRDPGEFEMKKCIDVFSVFMPLLHFHGKEHRIVSSHHITDKY